MGVQFSEKKRYVTLEWPLRTISDVVNVSSGTPMTDDGSMIK